MIPRDECEEIVAGEEIGANERDILRVLRSGQTTLERLGLERQEEAP
ncbi:MAG TPA: hypothetical protein VJK66_07330 [Gaiellaceae bacterium]|nr:hypothetical protein [Gaiellaceae bacterium]